MGGDPGGDDAEGEASAGFEEEEEFDVGEGGCGSAGDVEKGEEDDGGDAVVEERFTGELGLDVFGDADAAKHFEDGDGVGWGDEGAEEEALEPCGRNADEREYPIQDEGDDDGGEKGSRD